MTEDEPDAIYYFWKAAEQLEDEMAEPLYYLRIYTHLPQDRREW